MSIFTINIIANVRKVSTCLFLALFFCSQVYQFSHLHHFHNDGSLAVEVSYHPLNAEVEHASAHHHNAEESTQKNDNQHEYTNEKDWNLRRIQPSNNFTFDVQALAFSSDSSPSPAGIDKLSSFFLKPSYTKKRFISCPGIRGPPLFG